MSASSLETETVQLLWTSGWDSTFRLLQLMIDTPVNVQPVYVIDTQRQSTLLEIETMSLLNRLIAERFPLASGRIRPIKYFVKADIPKMPEVSEKLKNLKKRSYVGSQYDWLARLAFANRILHLELAIHRDDRAHNFIKGHVRKVHSASIGEYYELKDVEDSDLLLFAHFRFPILDWTKLQMLSYAKEKGVYDIMLKTWFCHQPIGQRPCGVCNPCRYSIREGMRFRFGKVALLRNRFALLFRIKNSLIRRFDNLISKI